MIHGLFLLPFKIQQPEARKRQREAISIQDLFLLISKNQLSLLPWKNSPSSLSLSSLMEKKFNHLSEAKAEASKLGRHSRLLSGNTAI